MSKLKDLINELCPDGVEYVKVGTLEDDGIITLGRGKVISRKDIKACPGGYPIYSSSIIDTGLFGKYGQYMFNDVRLSWSIDGGGKFFYRNDTRYSLTNVCGWLKVNQPEKADTKYLFYALSNEWHKKTFDYVHKAHPSVVRKEYVIPLPPLEIQKEIVKILDKFTAYDTELQTELQGRLKQYEYYRDKLLAFDLNIPKVKLGDVIKSLNTGLNPRKFFQLNTPDAKNYYITIREIHNGKIIPTEKTDLVNDYALHLCNKRSKLEKGDVLFSGTGTVGETVVVTEDPLNWNIKEGVYAIKPKATLNPWYLKFLLDTANMKTKYISKTVGGTVKSLPMAELQKIEIPLPPLPIQSRIVEVLDNFDKICSDLKIGLPAEIEKRQQQYEFYRDAILTFAEKGEITGQRERERALEG